MATGLDGFTVDERRIAVSGSLDSVASPTNQARHDTAAFPVDEEAFCAEVGATPLGEPGYILRECLTLCPSIDVTGRWGGYIGAGAKTVIPREAWAKLTMRPPPATRPNTLDITSSETTLKRACNLYVRS